MIKKDNTIRFILDGKIVGIDFSDSSYRPTTTLLQYLRQHTGHKGVKEGCAEGDCGACTVVIAGLDENNRLIYKAFDSCLIFLPQVHGKQVITVENVGNSAKLHPVQGALVKKDGSQCGYCTPGFVMSAFALYKAEKKPDREEILDALTGNLCRCTGYRPIIDAVIMSCRGKGKDHFTESEPDTARMLQQIRAKTKSRLIDTGLQRYFIPVSLDDALKVRKKYPKALVVGGGTDTALRVTKKRELLKEIIDLSFVSELCFVKETKKDITIGSGVSLEEVKEKVRQKYPALYNTLKVFGSRQIRNKATLGGNLGSASPIGDTPPVLMAYDAKVLIAASSGTREVPVREFITGYRTTVLAPGEIIYAVRIPEPASDLLIKSYKVSKRKDLDISTVSGCFMLRLDSRKKVKEIGLFYGGMAAVTKRAETTEAFLKGRAWERNTVEAAMKLIDEDFKPISDARSGAEGRRIMARNLLMKFWVETGG